MKTDRSMERDTLLLRGFKAMGHIVASRVILVRCVPNAKMPRMAILASLQQDIIIDACEKMKQVCNDKLNVITRLGVANCSVVSAK